MLISDYVKLKQIKKRQSQLSVSEATCKLKHACILAVFLTETFVKLHLRKAILDWTKHLLVLYPLCSNGPSGTLEGVYKPKANMQRFFQAHFPRLQWVWVPAALWNRIMSFIVLNGQYQEFCKSYYFLNNCKHSLCQGVTMWNWKNTSFGSTYTHHLLVSPNAQCPCSKEPVNNHS